MNTIDQPQRKVQFTQQLISVHFRYYCFYYIWRTNLKYINILFFKRIYNAPNK